MSSDVFQSLWIGSRLSSMELLSIESFLHFGYEYHLYCYQPIENVPQGVKVFDANEILPESEIYYQRGIFGAGSPASFSDIWRYKLLHEKGGWWVDADVVCIRPFTFNGDHVVGRQREGEGFGLNNAVIRAPAGSRLALRCYEESRRIAADNLPWGTTGPKLIDRIVSELGMDDCVQPPEAFYEIDFDDFGRLFSNEELPDETYGLHLWQAMWKDYGIDVDGPFPASCLYERLRRKFLSNYQPRELGERETHRIITKLIRANSPARLKRRRRVRRIVQAMSPWSKAA